MDEPAQSRRFRLSIRSMMVVIALCALLLALVAWSVQQQRLAIQAEHRARMMAELAMREAEQARRAAAQPLEVRTSAGGQPAARRSPATPSPGTAANGNSPLWSALSINHTVFRPEDLHSLTIEFTLVNDGTTPVDPKIPRSRIIVNGRELAESSRLLGGESRVARLPSLPPGDLLRFTLPLGDRFRTPGTYRVSWRGEDFQSPELWFRVLPEEAR